MTHRRTFTLTALLALVLLLAACGQDQPPVTGTPSPDGFVTLSVGIEGNNLSPQALAPQGVPYDTDGDAAVELVEFEVIDRNDQVVEFELIGGVYTATDGGTVTSVPLTKADSTAQVALLEAGNPYTFRALGFHETSAGSVIAYDSQEQNVTENGQVVLSLTAVLGDAVLTPRYPTTFVRSGDVLDLMLVVMANGHADFESGDYLQVPMADFTFDPSSLDVSGATVLNAGDRGVRIEVDGTCTGEVTASGGVVSGLVEDGNAYVEGNVTIAPLALDCPSAEGSVSTDVENPEVTLTFDPTTGLAEGTASDNHRIAAVRIFDGIVLVASTEEAEIGGDVAEIAFIGGGNEFRALITVQPLGGLSAVATDPSRNEGWSAETARVFVGAGGTGDGSERRPFGSLAEALAVVDDGGTVYVGAGTFEEQLMLEKDVIIIGAGAGETIIHAPSTAMDPIQTPTSDQYPILNIAGGAEVTISDVTVSGPFPEGTPCNSTNAGVSGVRVAGDAVLHMRDSSISNVNTQGSCQNATAMLVGRDADGEAGSAYLTNVEISVDSVNAKAGIVADGSGSHLSVIGGSVISHSPTEYGSPAQNGIQISRHATGEIEGVLIRGFQYEPDRWGGSAVLLFEPGHGVRVENNRIESSDLGVAYSPLDATSDVATFTMQNNSFSDNMWHIYNLSPQLIDATQGNSFNGITPDANTPLATLFEIEDHVRHAIDVDGIGIVRVVPGHLYVTNDRSIQAALDSAEEGDTIHVQSGDYSGQGAIQISTDGVSLLGPNSGTVPADARGDEAVLPTGMTISAANVTFSGFHIESAGNANLILLAEGALDALISSNLLVGSGPDNSARGVINVGKAEAIASITNNTFRDLRTGTFTDAPGAVYTVIGNLFTNNYSASAATGNDGTYRDNTYVDNYEGIGLAADNITVLDNTFDGNDAHVVLHSGDADLNAILAGNTFAGGGVIVDDSIVTQ